MSLTEQVVYAALSNIHPDPDNVNVHDEANIAGIVASIERFGFADPIGVVENPDVIEGGYLVVEGHGRLEAAQKLRMAEVPIIVLTMDEASRRGYGIAHNQIQLLTGLDMSAVAGEFGRLGVGDDDYPSLGFSQEDVLFMPAQTGHQLGGDQFSAPGGGEYQEQAQTGEGGDPDKPSTFGGFIPTVHQTVLRFSSDISYNRFLHLLSMARDRHPLAASISERLQLLLTDMGINGEPQANADD